jgi:hypothetical protein
MKRNGKDNRDSRHELSNDFVRMLSEDWQQNGKASLEKVRDKAPDRYCELIAKVVPKEMLIASDRVPTDATEPVTSKDIADRLLADIGLSHPSDQDRERALQAYDILIANLESIRDQALNLYVNAKAITTG